nr:hypothetical protein [Frigoriglobus tundricola]
MTGRLFLGAPLQITEVQRDSESEGQFLQFGVQDRQQLLCCEIDRDVRRPGGRLLLAPALGDLFRERAVGQPARDRVQPGTDRVATAHRVRVARQDEKGGLKHVLGQARIAQDALASAQHERAVPVEQCAERVAVARVGVPIQ